MALLNTNKKEINAKIVYYGPGLSGKTTNIQYIYKKLKPEHKGKLMTLATQTDRTLFFDFLPVELGEIKGLKIRFQLYTVPGQVFYNATRRLVLKNVDGIVFVAASEKDKLYDNIESFKNLEENIQHYGRSLSNIPFVMQYNKRDLPGILAVSELQDKINKYKSPYFEASANNGTGILQTLTAITKLVIHRLKTQTPVEQAGKVSTSETKEIRIEQAGESVNNATESFRTEAQPEKEQVLSMDNTKQVMEQRTQPKARKTLNIIELGKPEIVGTNTIIIPVVAADDNNNQYELKITLKL